MFIILLNFLMADQILLSSQVVLNWYIRLFSVAAEQLKTLDLGKLGNIKKISKFYRIIV